MRNLLIIKLIVVLFIGSFRKWRLYYLLGFECKQLVMRMHLVRYH